MLTNLASVQGSTIGPKTSNQSTKPVTPPRKPPIPKVMILSLGTKVRITQVGKGYKSQINSQKKLGTKAQGGLGFLGKTKVPHRYNFSIDGYS